MLINILKKNLLQALMLVLCFSASKLSASIASFPAGEFDEIPISMMEVGIITSGLLATNRTALDRFVNIANNSDEYLEDDITALHDALTSDIKNICFSFDEGDDAFKLAGTDGNTLLHIICADGNLQASNSVNVLITPENLNAQNSDGDTPLHLACKALCYDSIGILKVYHAASIHILNNDGVTAMEIAPLYDYIINEMLGTFENLPPQAAAAPVAAAVIECDAAGEGECSAVGCTLREHLESRAAHDSQRRLWGSRRILNFTAQ